MGALLETKLGIKGAHNSVFFQVSTGTEALGLL